jgi:hypothetical protein
MNFRTSLKEFRFVIHDEEKYEKLYDVDRHRERERERDRDRESR